MTGYGCGTFLCSHSFHEAEFNDASTKRFGSSIGFIDSALFHETNLFGVGFRLTCDSSFLNHHCLFYPLQLNRRLMTVYATPKRG